MTVVEFLTRCAERGADDCLSAKVTRLLAGAARDAASRPERDGQALLWRSALKHGAVTGELPDLCADYRSDARLRLWQRLDGHPDEPLHGFDARLAASVLSGDDVDRMVDRMVAWATGAAGTPGRAPDRLAGVRSVLAAVEDDRVFDALRAASPDGFVLVPCGEFLLGGGELPDENPSSTVWLPSFYLGRHPVTVAELRDYLAGTGAAPHPGSAGPADWPAHHLSWTDAGAFARWRGHRLPTEHEWEKAARGGRALRYPWGDEFDARRANTSESGIGELTPVDRYRGLGDAECGAVDMVGNAWEWTASRYAPYGQRLRGADPRPLDVTADRVLRGGAYDFDRHGCHNLNRYRCRPDRGWDTHGLRLAASV